MPFKVYRVSYIGMPLDHHAIFAQTESDGSGWVFHVTGNIQNGMTYEHKTREKPEDDFTFKSKTYLGSVTEANYGRINQVCEAVPVPKKQFEKSTRLHPNEPIRRCGEWADEATDALHRAHVFQDHPCSASSHESITSTIGITFPYYATDLPCSLPTEDEIDAVADLSSSGGGVRIVAVGSCLVVKYGKGVDLLEGQNMLFVREQTKIPVPRVYALYSKGGKNYIIMERIHGETLSSAWPQLNSGEKKRVVEKLRLYFDELRALKPPGYYGSLDNKYFLDDLFKTEEPNPAINGPFNSEDAFIEALSHKYDYDGGSVFRAKFLRQNLPRVLRGYSPVFTHGDYQRNNILIHEPAQDAPSQGPEAWQIYLLDWRESGWYPSYWEYAMAYCSLKWEDDWCVMLDQTLEPHLSVASWLYAMRRELWA